MTETSYDQFLANIVRTLAKSGFPARRVALPLERMYETAYAKKLNFNKALELLDQRGIAHEKTTEKVIFFAKELDFDLTETAGDQGGEAPDLQSMIAQAEAMLKSMPPDQLRQMEQMLAKLSDEQKAEMMQRAHDMGLLK